MRFPPTTIPTPSTIMVSTRRNAKIHQIVQGVPCDDSGEDCDHDGLGSSSVTAQRPGSRAPKKAVSKQKGKHRIAGKLSKLPDMPLDILYEVRHRIYSVALDGLNHDAFDVYRYSLLFTQWTCCGCRGPARPFVTSSRAIPRNRFGYPLSKTSLGHNAHLHALRT